MDTLLLGTGHSIQRKCVLQESHRYAIMIYLEVDLSMAARSAYTETLWVCKFASENNETEYSTQKTDVAQANVVDR